MKVKSQDSAVKKQREEQAQRVLDEFGDVLSDCRLLCFFDDEDCQEFKVIMGRANRGFLRTITDSTSFVSWPEYITDVVGDPASFGFKPLFGHVIYLYGSTCANRVGMTMTFAHELQHVVQSIQMRELLNANNLFRELPEKLIQSVGLRWSDIPTEREARAVAKKIAVTLHGSEAVKEFLAQRAAQASITADPIELADVGFIQELDTSMLYDLRHETLALFGRFKNHRSEFEAVIEWLKSGPDFEPVDLDSFMPRLDGGPPRI